MVWSRQNQPLLLCSLICLSVSGTAYGVVKHSESAYDIDSGVATLDDGNNLSLR